MKPLIHAQYSAVKHGGEVDDYMPIHEFIDSSKAHVPDMRHRAILHSSFGIYIAQEVFGYYITNSEGKRVSVRDVAEEHVLQDLGTIPTVQDWLSGLPLETWMGGPEGRKKTRRVAFVDGSTWLDTDATEAPEVPEGVLRPRMASPIDVLD